MSIVAMASLAPFTRHPLFPSSLPLFRLCLAASTSLGLDSVVPRYHCLQLNVTLFKFVF